MVSSGIMAGLLEHLVNDLTCKELAGFPLVVGVGNIPENNRQD